jgi:hypothetical protein
MAQANSIQIRQPWTLLHEREQRERRSEVDSVSKAERAAAARMIEARLSRLRDRAFTDVTMCSRPYY